VRRTLHPLVAAVTGALLIAVMPASAARAAGPDRAASPDPDLTPREPGAHSVVFREEAVIAAHPARIWRLLVDLPGYSNWNPWVIRAEGDAAPGGAVEVDVVLGKHTMRAQHVVLVVEPEARFCWRDAGWNSWFVYGQRCRTLRPQADGTVLFQQELLLDGPLSSIAKLVNGRDLRHGMAAETAALKEHAERQPR
jgi:uncharacterized protein YndB with AHSA1/START domain